MAGMVIVNNPGTWDAIYWPLEHAEWNGWTPTDLIFPFFVFLVGVSLTLSWQTQLVTRRPDLRTWPAHHLPRAVHGGVSVFQPHTLADTRRVAAHRSLLPRRSVHLSAHEEREGDRRDRRRRCCSGIGWCSCGSAISRRTATSARASIGALMGGHLWRPTWDPEGLLSTVPAIATALLGVLAGLWLRSPVQGERKVNVLALAGIAGMAAGQAWHIALSD